MLLYRSSLALVDEVSLDHRKRKQVLILDAFPFEREPRHCSSFQGKERKDREKKAGDQPSIQVSRSQPLAKAILIPETTSWEGTIAVRLVSADDLAPSSSSQACDPYVQVSLSVQPYSSVIAANFLIP